MHNSGKIVLRLLAAISVAAIFIVIAHFLLKHYLPRYLPRDLHLSQTFRFNLVEVSSNTPGAKWNSFAKQQKDYIESELALEIMPDLARYLSVTAAGYSPDAGHSPELTIKLRAPKNFTARASVNFHRLTGAYRAIRLAWEDSSADDPKITRFALLDKNFYEMSRNSVLSHLQWLLLAAFGVSGFLLGLLLPDQKSSPAAPSRQSDEPLSKSSSNPASTAISADPKKNLSAPEPSSAPGTCPTIEIDLEQNHPDPDNPNCPYRSMITLVDQLCLKHPAPALVIAAANPHEISPRFTVNLAIALAKTAHRVLLIEPDLGSRDLAQLFEFPETPGLLQWLTSQTDLTHSIHNTRLTNLSVMTSGSGPQDESGPDYDFDLLPNRWQKLHKTFDVILLYCPADLSFPLPLPASAVVQLADATLLLTRRKKISDSEQQKILNRLDDNPAIQPPPPIALIKIKN